MKTHRQIRNKRVSSETGVAVLISDTSEVGRFEKCVNEMEHVLKPFAPNEQRALIVALATRVLGMKSKEEEKTKAIQAFSSPPGGI